MKKITEIAELIVESLYALAWLAAACLIPFAIIRSIFRLLQDNGLGDMPFTEQVIYMVGILWMIDLIVRPIIAKVLNTNIDRINKVFMWQPSKKQEEIEDARCTTAATAKDA